jgi:hypothetical protein
MKKEINIKWLIGGGAILVVLALYVIFTSLNSLKGSLSSDVDHLTQVAEVLPPSIPPSPAFDLNRDGKLDVKDRMEITRDGLFAASIGDSRYSVYAYKDVNADGKITNLDAGKILSVSNAYGQYDLNLDGIIGNRDHELVRAKIPSKIGDPLYYVPFDVNADGYIDNIDISLMEK